MVSASPLIPPGIVQPAVTALERARYVSVTTYRKDGRPVATPVEFVVRGPAIYFRTAKDAGKIKRIRRNAAVRVTACSMRGKVSGTAYDGIATLVDDAETRALHESFSRKYGLLWRIGSRLRHKTQGVRVDIAATAPATP